VFVVFAGLVVIFVRRLMLVMLEFDVIAEGGDVQGVFVGCVGFGFRDGLRSAHDFLDGRLVLLFVLVGFFSFGEFFFFLFLCFDFVFFERGAGGEAIGLRFLADFILFCVDQASGEGGALVIA